MLSSSLRDQLASASLQDRAHGQFTTVGFDGV
jgi:hypothetical protein